MKNMVRVIESVGAGYAYIKHKYPSKIEVVGSYYVFNTELVHRVPFRGMK